MGDSGPTVRPLFVGGVLAGASDALELPSGTVTFLLTDVESSSRLWEERADEMTVAIPRHYEIFDEVVERHDGVRPQEQGEGDSIVAAFARATDAIAAALDAQRALVAEAPLLRVRIAVHSGEAQLRDGQNYVGHALIRCARLRSCARGGQILASDVTAGLVADRLPVGAELVDLGVHRLRDLSRPERVWQLAHRDLQAEFPPLRSLDAFRHNLPAARTPLVGRTRELAELHMLVVDRQLVTITGSGGVGKTRLAQQIAADLVDRFDDGVCWAELAPVSDPRQVASAIASAVGVVEMPGVAVVDGLVSVLRDRRLLLLVDNCEHQVDAVAPVLQRVLDECGGVHIVATSREPVGVVGETTWRAPSLALPPEDTDVDQPEAYDAVRLFLERAREARPNFTLTREAAVTVGHICARLDGIPLAIELAASRVRSFPLERLAAELDQRFRILTGGARTAIARQRTLLASVEWSYELLDDVERTTLRRLGPFMGGCTLDAAEFVCSDERLDEYEVLDVLGRLVDKSLVQLDDTTGRYVLLETIRVYVLDQASIVGDLVESRGRHLAWALHVAALWDLEHSVPTVELVETIEPDYANLLAAFEWSLVTEPAIELLTPLCLIWVTRSRFAEAEEWTRRTLESIPSDSLRRAQVIARVGSANTGAGGPPIHEGLLVDALERAERAHDTWSTARLRLHHATLHSTYDPTVDTAGFDEALALLEASGDNGGVVEALGIAAVIVCAGGDSQTGSSYLRRLTAVRDSHAFDYLAAQAAAMVGLQTGHFQEALEAIDRAVGAAPPAPRTGLLFLAAQIAIVTGDLERLDRMIAALPPAEERGLWDGWTHLVLGSRAFLLGDTRAAIENAEAAHRIGSAGLPSVPVSVGAALGLAGLGEYDAAERILREALPDERNTQGWMVSVCQTEALIALARDDLTGVERAVFADLDTRRAQGHVPFVANYLELLACVSTPERAVRLAAAVTRIREETGQRSIAPVVTERLDALLSSARHTLGDDTVDALSNEGAALDWEQAAEYALRMHSERGRPSFGWSSLTPTETQVVGLVAEGLTNRQIAERLLVEPSTVKSHLHHVFTKLGVSTRAELAVAASRRAERA